MKPKQGKKLNLNKKTIADLSRKDLMTFFGGVITVNGICGDTKKCNTTATVQSNCDCISMEIQCPSNTCGGSCVCTFPPTCPFTQNPTCGAQNTCAAC